MNDIQSINLTNLMCTDSNTCIVHKEWLSHYKSATLTSSLGCKHKIPCIDTERTHSSEALRHTVDSNHIRQKPIFVCSVCITPDSVFLSPFIVYFAFYHFGLVGFSGCKLVHFDQNSSNVSWKFDRKKESRSKIKGDTNQYINKSTISQATQWQYTALDFFKLYLLQDMRLLAKAF